MNKLVELIRPKVNTCGYVWGSQGELLTPPKLEWFKLTFGAIHYDFNDNGMQVSASKWLNKQVFDCSGLIVWALQTLNFISKDGDYNATMLCNDLCVPVSAAELTEGDLVFIYHEDTGECSHVGVYIGGGQVIQAQGTAAGVTQTPLWDSFNKFGHLVFDLQDTVEEEKICDKLVTKGWITSKDYWVKVLAGKEPMNLNYLLILFNRMSGFTGSSTNADAIGFLMNKGVITDKFYWDAVFNNKIKVDVKWLKVLLNKAIVKL